MRQILPRVYHWTAVHPQIGVEVSSYYLVDERVLLDPLLPSQGLDAFEAGVDHIFLTNRHHYRHSDQIAARYGCTVWCVEHGLHEFTRGQKVKPFRFGDTLPGGIETIEIGVICPDETALLIPRDEGLLAIADGVIRDGDGPLSFVPDKYMGGDLPVVKAGLQRSFHGVLQQRFDHLLLAHGDPWIGGGLEALRRFASA
jgi:hypothetical protein